MPTIDELAPATAASDTDELPVFQAGISRKVTRAQLLAGFQEGLAVTPGTLLGRSSAGTGAPEAIGVGANLTLVAGTLSAPAPFNAAKLPAGRPPGNTDLVPMNQSGADAAVAYGPFMSGLSALSGIDMSAHVVRPATASVPRTLADSLSDLWPSRHSGGLATASPTARTRSTRPSTPAVQSCSAQAPTFCEGSAPSRERPS